MNKLLIVGLVVEPLYRYHLFTVANRQLEMN